MSAVLTDPVRDALAEGYVRGVPPWCPGVEKIDGPIARKHPCDLCGKPCSYLALHHKPRRSYRAFAVCTGCGNAQEWQPRSGKLRQETHRSHGQPPKC